MNDGTKGELKFFRHCAGMQSERGQTFDFKCAQEGSISGAYPAHLFETS